MPDRPPMTNSMRNAVSNIIAVVKRSDPRHMVAIQLKIFNWIATMWRGSLRFTTAMMFDTAFLIEFVIGGLSGITFAAAPIDWQTTDTYYVVAHFHYVVFGGSAFAILAATHYWFPKMTGRLLSERLGRAHFWLMVVGFNL